MKVLRYCIADSAIKLCCSVHLAAFLPSSASGLRHWRGCSLKVSSPNALSLILQYSVPFKHFYHNSLNFHIPIPNIPFQYPLHSTLRRQSRTDSQWWLWSGGKRPWGNHVVPQAMPRRSRAALPGKLWGMLVYAASLSAAVNVFSLEVFSDIIAKTSNLALCECSPLIGQIIAACLTVFVLPTLLTAIQTTRCGSFQQRPRREFGQQDICWTTNGKVYLLHTYNFHYTNSTTIVAIQTSIKSWTRALLTLAKQILYYTHPNLNSNSCLNLTVLPVANCQTSNHVDNQKYINIGIDILLV